MSSTCPFGHVLPEFKPNEIISISPKLKKASYGANKFLILSFFIDPLHLVGLGLFGSLLLPSMVTAAFCVLLLIYPLAKQILRHCNYLATPYSEDIIRTKYTARFDGDFVVFLIGARPNTANPFNKYTAAVGQAFQSMVEELENDKTLGYLGGDIYIGMNTRKSTTLMVQYWRSYEALQKWTHTRMGIHMKGVANYMQEDSVAGITGIWHETYKVRDGEYETVYGNIPPMGLALATSAVPELKMYNGTARMVERRKEKEKIQNN